MPDMYVEIRVATAFYFADAENIKRQEDGLRWLVTKHLGDKITETSAIFKTLPEDASIVETYGNDTTCAALLHFSIVGLLLLLWFLRCSSEATSL